MPRTGAYAVQGEDEIKGWQLAVETITAIALTLATRAYIINNGHIAHEGPTGEIRTQPELLQRYLGV